MKGACETHAHAPSVEAEVLREGPKFTKVMLRCDECGRRRGERLLPRDPTPG